MLDKKHYTYEGANVEDSGRKMMKIMLKEMVMVTDTGWREHR